MENTKSKAQFYYSTIDWRKGFYPTSKTADRLFELALVLIGVVSIGICYMGYTGQL